MTFQEALSFYKNGYKICRAYHRKNDKGFLHKDQGSAVITHPREYSAKDSQGMPSVLIPLSDIDADDWELYEEKLEEKPEKESSELTAEEIRKLRLIIDVMPKVLMELNTSSDNWSSSWDKIFHSYN